MGYRSGIRDKAAMPHHEDFNFTLDIPDFLPDKPLSGCPSIFLIDIHFFTRLTVVW